MPSSGALAGISSKMLTQTLRELERHGIVNRHDYGEVPPRVEYALTPLGRSLAALVVGIENWVTANYTRMTGQRAPVRRRVTRRAIVTPRVPRRPARARPRFPQA